MRRVIAITALLLAACGSHDSHLATAVTDTLPGGIVRVTSDGPTGWADTSGWRFVPMDSIAPPAGSPGELINPSSMAVDTWGRVYVADQSPTVIKLYDSTGAFIRMIGREGDGPGEFRTAYIAVRGNRLMVHDPRSQRTAFFDTSGTLIRSFQSVGSVWADEVELDAANRAVLPILQLERSDSTPEPAELFARFDTLGTPLDTIVVPRLTPEHVWELTRDGRRMMTTTIPFASSTNAAFDRDSGVVYGATSDFSLLRSAGHGDTMLVLRRSWEPSPLSDSLRKAALEQRIERMKARYDEIALRNAFRLSDIPTTAPNWVGLIVDDFGNTWALRPEHPGDLTFDVFDRQGAWLGPVALRADDGSASALRIAHGMLYMATMNADGFPVIRRWAIQGRHGGQDGQDGQEGT